MKQGDIVLGQEYAVMRHGDPVRVEALEFERVPITNVLGINCRNGDGDTFWVPLQYVYAPWGTWFKVEEERLAKEECAIDIIDREGMVLMGRLTHLGLADSLVTTAGKRLSLVLENPQDAVLLNQGLLWACAHAPGARLSQMLEQIKSGRFVFAKGDLQIPDLVIALAEEHSETWRDGGVPAFLEGLLSEVAELVDALAGTHEHPAAWELMQIGSICINFMRYLKERPGELADFHPGEYTMKWRDTT